MGGQPESGLRSKLLEAVERALAGDWRAAHLIAQEHEGDEIANWIHAVVHRLEGDEGNARYWYRRCGRPFREEVATDQELREIRAVLQGGPGSASAGEGGPRGRGRR
jgi:hypothetical protein